MASLFVKFQQFVKVLAKDRTFAKDPRQLQFEADVNKLFLFTSYNRLGRDAEEAEIEEIIELGSKASLADQQKQVQENIHQQIENFSSSMDQILLTENETKNESEGSGAESSATPRTSGLIFAVGSSTPHANSPVVPETKPLSRTEVSKRIKDLIGYTLSIRPSQVPHKDAGQGLFIEGEADVGAVIAFYPGVIYSPAYYRYIPGYPRVDAHNSYLITRYDGTVINAQPWAYGGEERGVWDGSIAPNVKSKKTIEVEKGSDRLWKMLSKPLKGSGSSMEVLERRNPLAFGHFANHPAKGVEPNVMICPYDFPLSEKGMRPYIPNISFGSPEQANMKRFGSFWFKTGSTRNNGADVSSLRSLVLVATRALCDEEILLNYRLSNSKRRPEWYTPVDEEEDRRRWS